MFMKSSDGNVSSKLEAEVGFLTQVVADISVRLFNACVYVPVGTGTVWAEPGTPEWHNKADMGKGILATSPADCVSMSSGIEAGVGKTDDYTERFSQRVFLSMALG